MTESRTLLLGAIAGATILLGMPLGRLKSPVPSLRQFLNALAIGILLFLTWDVLSGAWAPIDNHLVALHEGKGSLPGLIGYAVLFVTGLAVGLMSLVYYERWLGRQKKVKFGPGAMNVEELPTRSAAHASDPMHEAKRLALLIAVGIGLHNFAEGLGIGGAAAAGEIGLATVLVIGFALHNATEGFGITAPLAAAGLVMSWPRLLLLALIGGGPTFVGTAIGRTVNSEPLTVAFLMLAAGSIIYVIVQLLSIGLKSGRREVLYWGLIVGLLAGFITDGVVSYAGI